MALPNEFIINNTTGSPITIEDLGVPVASNGTVILSSYATMQEIRDSASLYNLITAGTVRIRVGGVNLSQAASKRFFVEPLDSISRTPVIAAADTNTSISGTTTIDGISVVAGNRVLLTGQTDNTENGIWIVQSGSWVRPYDFNTGDSCSGLSVVVQRGTANGDAIWVCSSDPGVDTIGTSNLFFSKQEGSSGVQSSGSKPVGEAKYIDARGPVGNSIHFGLPSITEV